MNRSFYSWLTGIVLIIAIGMTALSQVEAVFPNNFWRITDNLEAGNLNFKFGDRQEPNAKLHFMENGSLGIGDFPSGASVLLELIDNKRGFLIPRVSTTDAVNDPRNGMLVYDNTARCFKFYQRGRLGVEGRSWSECVGTAQRVRVEATEPRVASRGEIYYNSTSKGLYIHNGDVWMLVSSDMVLVDTREPGPHVSQPGDLFFNTDTNQLMIFDGDLWQLISLNFNYWDSFHSNCRQAELANGARTFACQNNEFLSGISLEPSAWSNQNDHHIPPEISNFKCCGLTFIPEGERTFECDNLIINGDFEFGNENFSYSNVYRIFNR